MAFERNLEDNLFALREDLVNHIYKHGPYHTFHIYDPKHRIISKATVRDRVVHHLIFRELYEIFNPTFIFHSYSSRLGKGAHRAVKNLSKILRSVSHNYTQPTFALKCDIKQFFASVPHQKLLTIIQRKIKESVLRLVEQIVASFSSQPLFNNSTEIASSTDARWDFSHDGIGLPIGNVTSQIFANIYLNELDQFIKHTLKVKHYFRYADDFVLLNDNQNILQQQLNTIDNFLQTELSLLLHPDKVSIKKYTQGIDFLGYVILPRHIVLRTKTKRRMFKKLTEKKLLWQMGEITDESFNNSLQSYLGMLKHGDCFWLRQKILEYTH